ncbi:glycosyltransferase [uncultured Roseibium sp.]|uniref:glycosyltransferase n=1 Tax=uncultured Roseibium sp. TaxID=1936171 RepID=UPI0026118AED|nr:glycosyltransferase [uncultured Roseibium sp.]
MRTINRLLQNFVRKNFSKIREKQLGLKERAEKKIASIGFRMGRGCVCLNLKDINFGVAAGVPNFTLTLIPFLNRAHRDKFEIYFLFDGEIEQFPEIAEVLKVNKIIKKPDEVKYFYQFNFHHFQERELDCLFLSTFFHDLHVFTIPWKYDSNFQAERKLLRSVYEADVCVTYFPYTLRWLSSEKPFGKILKVPQFTLIDVTEHGQSKVAQKIDLSDSLNIFFPSHCQPHKNHSVVIKAVRELTRRNQNVKLILTGNDESNDYVNQCRAMISEYNIKDQVIWLDRVTEIDLIELYRVSDVVVQPSLAEGGAMIALEATLFGKPACVAAIPQAKEALEELGKLRDVRWFEPNDHCELASQLETFISQTRLKPEDVQFAEKKKYSFTNIERSAELIYQNWPGIN